MWASKFASRHSGAHFFNILASKSVPNLQCFLVRLDFKTCFAPERRALFEHLNLQKRSEPAVFLSFFLPNLLRATTACNFLVSHPARWGSPPAALGNLLFDSPGQQTFHKHSVAQLFYLFARLALLSTDFLFSHFFSSDSFSYVTFSLLLPHLPTSRKFAFCRICAATLTT